ncbi:hypothetical protein [Streptomyces cyaneofuscatus]|uniref:hypothetical protein n=1 Tax=Streptomyces cyaneofuscatus TaxID=66883 RepID=UPI0036B67B62
MHGWNFERQVKHQAKIEIGSENVPWVVIDVRDPFSRRFEAMRSGGLVELCFRPVSGVNGSDQLSCGEEELRSSFGHMEIASCGAGVLGKAKPGTPPASAEQFVSLPFFPCGESGPVGDEKCFSVFTGFNRTPSAYPSSAPAATSAGVTADG